MFARKVSGGAVKTTAEARAFLIANINKLQIESLEMLTFEEQVFRDKLGSVLVSLLRHKHP